MDNVAGASHSRPKIAPGADTPSRYAAGESEKDRKRRAECKRLASIFEEHELPYSMPHSDEELEARRREAAALRKIDATEVLDMERRARKVDLCFVIGATGCMARYITHLKNVIWSIVSLFTIPQISHNKKTIVLSSIRLACVVYRDNRKEDKHVELFDFTENVWEFRTFLSSVIATGSREGNVLRALIKTR